jgi:hypothetical protein
VRDVPRLPPRSALVLTCGIATSDERSERMGEFQAGAEAYVDIHPRLCSTVLMIMPKGSIVPCALRIPWRRSTSISLLCCETFLARERLRTTGAVWLGAHALHARGGIQRCVVRDALLSVECSVLRALRSGGRSESSTRASIRQHHI